MGDKLVFMRKIATVILLIFVVSHLYAQQTYPYRYHIFDDYLLNPAYVGSQNYYPVLIGHDQRFIGLSEGSPQTYFLSLHSRVGEGYIFEKDGKINKFFSQFGNMALGFQFYQYRFGPENETNIGLTYGYHLDLNQNYIRKNPRKLIFALTPRLQGMYYSLSNLHLVGDELGVDEGSTYTDPNLGGYSNYRTWIFSSDVAALFQSVHVDVGIGALNFIQTKNKLETEVLDLSDTTFTTYDSLYPTRLLFNAKLKFIDIYTSDRLDVYFIPKVALLWATKRNYSEIFTDLMFEATFKNHIAGIRKEVMFTGQLGLNINHRREYNPITLLQPYIALDFKNYTITYAHSIYLENDLVGSGATIGGNQISVLFKISRDRVVRENRYTTKFIGR